MRSTDPEFSEAMLSELLRALRRRIDDACGESAARGHSRTASPGRIHDGRAIRSTTEAPPWHA